MTSCHECIFFVKINPGGECHRHPPVRLPREFAKEATSGSRVRNEEIKWGWPAVNQFGYDACGEGRRS